jgi:hypothetical protein
MHAAPDEQLLVLPILRVTTGTARSSTGCFARDTAHSFEKVLQLAPALGRELGSWVAVLHGLYCYPRPVFGKAGLKS